MLAVRYTEKSGLILVKGLYIKIRGIIMRSNKLFEAIGGAKDKYLKRSEKNRIPTVSYAGWIACAACICIVALGVILYKPDTAQEVIINQTVLSPQLGLPSADQSGNESGLATLDSGTFFGIEGMGFEAYDSYDLANYLRMGCTNADSIPDTMPVFKNLSYNPYSLAYGLDERELMELTWDVLAGLGVDPFAKDLTKFEKERASDSPRDPRGSLIPDDAVIKIRLTAGFGYITVNADGFIEISYTDGVALPAEYSIKTDPETAMTYLAEQYSALLDFDLPVIEISEKRLESGIPHSLVIYDGAGNMTQQLLNYTYEYARFYFDSDGNLTMIRINNQLSVAEHMGYYPTISATEAKAQLLEGRYYTSYMGEDILAEENIAGVSLAYRTSDVERIWVPFYRFYIEIPDQDETSYAAFYVPAIELDYIKTTYTPDFSFNN